MTSTNQKTRAYALTGIAIAASTLWLLGACTASASFQAGGADQPSAPPPPPPPPPPPEATATATTPPAATTAPAPAPTPTTTTPAAPLPTKTTVSVKADKVVVPEAIEFDPGTATLKAGGTSEAGLENLRLFLDQNARVTKLRIEGYTDNQGKPEDNEKLSGDRALTIKKWLVDKGIAKDRLIAAAFGQNKPVADNATPEGRAKNQRMEFKLAELSGKKYLNREPSGGGKVVDF